MGDPSILQVFLQIIATHKSHKIWHERLPMTTHGLILSKDGAIHSRMLFVSLRSLLDLMCGPFWTKMYKFLETAVFVVE